MGRVAALGSFEDGAMKASRNFLLFRITNVVGVVAIIVFLAALVCRFVSGWNNLTFCLMVGSMVLFFLWAIPLSFSFVGPLDDPTLKRCNKSRGEICLPSRTLLVSDRWDFGGAVELGMAESQIGVSAVIRKRLVKSVHIGLKPADGRAAIDVVQIPVDTGHLIFADRDILQHIDSKAIEQRIMLVLSSDEPLTLFLRDSRDRPLGFAVGTGHGDGRYTLLADSRDSAQYVKCRFA